MYPSRHEPLDWFLVQQHDGTTWRTVCWARAESSADAVGIMMIPGDKLRSVHWHSYPGRLEATISRYDEDLRSVCLLRYRAARADTRV